MLKKDEESQQKAVALFYLKHISDCSRFFISTLYSGTGEIYQWWKVPYQTLQIHVIHVGYSWYIYLHLLDFYGFSCRVNIPFVPWILWESTCSTTLLEPRKRVSVTIRRPSVTGFPSVSVTSCFFLKLVFFIGFQAEHMFVLRVGIFFF